MIYQLDKKVFYNILCSMFDFLQDYYDWLKAFHIVFMACWISSMFYITRLFVWHASLALGTETYASLIMLEKKALRLITNPTMILTISLGLCLAQIYGWASLGKSFYIKMTGVFLMVVIHMIIARSRRRFEIGANKAPRAFYQGLGYSIVIIFAIVVVMAAVKPFSD